MKPVLEGDGCWGLGFPELKALLAQERELCLRDVEEVSRVFKRDGCLGFHGTRKTPNDPKLSDGGGWRAGCTVGGKAAAEAASVTAGAVRCSAWLGVSGRWLFCILSGGDSARVLGVGCDKGSEFFEMSRETVLKRIKTRLGQHGQGAAEVK